MKEEKHICASREARSHDWRRISAQPESFGTIARRVVAGLEQVTDVDAVAVVESRRDQPGVHRATGAVMQPVGTGSGADDRNLVGGAHSITPDIADHPRGRAEHCGEFLRGLEAQTITDNAPFFSGEILGVLAHNSAPPAAVVPPHNERITDAARRAGDGVDDESGAQAAACGNLMPCVFATSLRCANREAGMPFFRQLWTVEIGASIIRATADVPPSASIT